MGYKIFNLCLLEFKIILIFSNLIYSGMICPADTPEGEVKRF